LGPRGKASLLGWKLDPSTGGKRKEKGKKKGASRSAREGFAHSASSSPRGRKKKEEMDGLCAALLHGSCGLGSRPTIFEEERGHDLDLAQGKLPWGSDFNRRKKSWFSGQ